MLLLPLGPTCPPPHTHIHAQLPRAVHVLGDAATPSLTPVPPLLPQDAAARVAHMATEMLDYVEKLPPFQGHSIKIR